VSILKGPQVLTRMLAGAALAASLLMLSGCGYSLAGRGSFLPDYIRIIGIPTFANRTSLFNLETQMTEKVRAEFIGRGKYRIVPDAEGVDALLVGEVTGINIRPVSFTNQQLASRYTITMTARVELRDQRENKVLWENPALVFSQEYEAAQNTQAGQAAVDPTAFFGQDQNALDRMTTEFSRSIVSAILEAF
jgi:outer membrane lipopolysaccharide assembly protein LptE/RlpB